MAGAPGIAPSQRARGQALEWVVALAAVGVCAALYARTICPTAYWGDGMELAAAAKCLGVAHPTGYPLYVLLGRIFLDLPIGSNGLRMNLLSAVSTLAAVGLLFGFSGAVFRIVAPGAGRRRLAFTLTRAGVAASFGASLFVWRHAVQTEVYPTFVAVQIGCLWLLVAAYERRSLRGALALAFLYGIAWQSHMLSVLLLPPVAALTLGLILRPRRGAPGDSSPPRRPRMARAIPCALLVFAIGVSGYVALPIRARANPPMNWGDPSTPQRFFDHLRGSHYAETRLLADPASVQRLRGPALRHHLRQQAGSLLRWPAFQFCLFAPGASLLIGAAIWGLGVWGALILMTRRLLLGLGLLGALAGGVGVLLAYNIPDIDAYFLAVWPLLLVFAWIIPVVAGFGTRSGAVGAWTIALAAMAVPVFAAPANFPLCDLSEYREAEEYGRALLDLLPEDAILLTSDDSATFAAWYQQVVEGRRRDVVVYGLNFIFQGWYQRVFDTPQAEGLSFFSTDLPTQAQPDYLVAIGGGVIIPNVNKRPMFLATPDPWLRMALVQNWAGERIADIFPVQDWRPPFPAAKPAATLHRLGDNPEYRAYQQRQFEEIYGDLWPVRSDAP